MSAHGKSLRPRRVSWRTARSLSALLTAIALIGCGGTEGSRAPLASAARASADAERSVGALEPTTTEPKGAPSAEVASASATPTPQEAPKETEAPKKTEAPRPELPRGGRELFPAYRLVGFCGTPGAPALGRLAGNLTTHTKAIESYAKKHANGREGMPVFELIAVVVQGAPGKDGKWRRRVPDGVVDEYLKVARAAKGLLLLNIQPGHSDFMTETKHFEKYLREPDVGVALDPEWAMKGKQKPGVYYGQTTGAVIGEVAAYLSGLVKEGDLPEKALVFHQVNNRVLKDESAITAHPGVVIIKSVDGLGRPGPKIRTYGALIKSMADFVHPGFKLFFDEDTRNGSKLMTPAQVMRLTPEPEYVMYE